MSGWTAVVKAKRTDRPAHQVLFPDHDYLNEFSDIFDHDRPPTSPTVYVCAQEKSHGREGWDEHEPVFIMANAPAEPAAGTRNADIWGELESKVMTRLRERGILAKDDQIVWRRTPGKLASTFPGSRGSIYGAASNNQFAAFQRAPNAVKDLPGLYVATGSAHPGGGVPLCMLSGRAAVESM
jgi:phytoene dehydrogenase-like protein